MKTKTKPKEFYESPAVAILEFKSEGIICTSDQDGEGEGYEGWD